MSTYAVDGDKLTAIADAIRLKRDTTADMTLDDMPLQIGLIESGGVKTAEGTIVATDTSSLTIDVGFRPLAFAVWAENASDVQSLSGCYQWIGISFASVRLIGYLDKLELSTTVWRKAATGNMTSVGESAQNMFAEVTDTSLTVKTNNVSSYPIRPITFRYKIIG